MRSVVMRRIPVIVSREVPGRDATLCKILESGAVEGAEKDCDCCCCRRPACAGTCGVGRGTWCVTCCWLSVYCGERYMWSGERHLVCYLLLAVRVLW
jgi:hypothetical protein